jgi:hypothetical protein
MTISKNRYNKINRLFAPFNLANLARNFAKEPSIVEKSGAYSQSEDFLPDRCQGLVLCIGLDSGTSYGMV